MNEPEYRNAVFLLNAACDSVKRLRASKATAEEVTEAEGNLKVAQARVSDLVQMATPGERREISVALAKSREHGY